jgi:hypothetical protein
MVDEGDGATDEQDGGGSGEDPTGREIAPLSLGDALGIVGEETRARILIELGEAWDEDQASFARLSFTELMERVGVEDSGRFNYHLDKLVGTFIQKTEEGYMLQVPGHLLYRAIVAGTLTERAAMDPTSVGECHRCGGTLTAQYEGSHVLAVTCDDCEQVMEAVPFPHRGTEGRSIEEVVDAAVQRNRHELSQLRRGVCHTCGAAVDRRLATDIDDFWEDPFGYDVYAVLSCRACNASFILHPVAAAVTAPPVVHFFADHGYDTFSLPSWKSPIKDAENATEIREEDPLTVVVPYELDGERLDVVLDADLTVVETTRERVTD